MQHTRIYIYKSTNTLKRCSICCWNFFQWLLIVHEQPNIRVLTHYFDTKCNNKYLSTQPCVFVQNMKIFIPISLLELNAIVAMGKTIGIETMRQTIDNGTKECSTYFVFVKCLAFIQAKKQRKKLKKPTTTHTKLYNSQSWECIFGFASSWKTMKNKW